MKTILKIMVMITVMVIVTGSSVYAQIKSFTCASSVPPGGCVGECVATLWYGPNNPVPSANIFITCENINNHCQGVAYIACPLCSHNGKCNNACPPLYLSSAGGAAIQGKVFNTSTPTSPNPVCGCKYVVAH